jgi:integrase
MSLYKREGSEIWWVNIRHAGRRVRRSTGTPDRAAAQQAHNEIQIELWTLVPNTSEHTWGDAVELWTTAETRSDSELLSLAKFGKGYPDRVLASVTAESIEEALKFCKTAATFMRYRTMIMAILNRAKAKDWITTLPKVATRRDKKKKTREWITQAQWAKLYAELPKHMKPMAEFAVETGLRQANVLGLTWARTDVERKLVWVEADETKGDAALPIPLSEGALRVLAECKDQHDEFVFTYRGKPIKEVKTSFCAACVRAGLGSWGDDARYHGFTWHGLRHTWATWHVQNGTPLEVLQKLGGWADLRMVMNYAHHSPGHLASYANNVRKKT